MRLWCGVAFDIDGCEMWLSWERSVDNVDPHFAIFYEVTVNGIADRGQDGIERWVTYGTESTNTFTVQAVDSAGNRPPESSLTLNGQFC